MFEPRSDTVQIGSIAIQPLGFSQKDEEPPIYPPNLQECLKQLLDDPAEEVLKIETPWTHSLGNVDMLDVPGLKVCMRFAWCCNLWTAVQSMGTGVLACMHWSL